MATIVTLLSLLSGFECSVPGAVKCSKRANGCCSAFYYEGIAIRNSRGKCNFLGAPEAPKVEAKKLNSIKASKRGVAGQATK